MGAMWERLKNNSSISGLEGLNPPATDADFCDFQRKVGVALPVEFVEFMRVHDGQSGDSDPIFNGYRFLSVEEIIMNWSIMNDLVVGGAFKKRASKNSIEVQSAWWSRNWIPFADNGAGDLLCLDMEPSVHGTVGQVIEYCHDMPDREILAKSFNEWLDGFINA